jgi:hypothetical protein
MSQVVYTELEGQPLRWEYKGTIPMESRQEASRTPKTWSVSQTNTNQKGNTTTTAAMDVYSSNQVGEIIKTPANAVRTNQIQVYGLRTGTPPNPLRIEIRKAKLSKSVTFVRYSPGTASDRNLIIQPSYFFHGEVTTALSSGENVIKTLSPNLPAGKNVILAAVSALSAVNINFRLKIKRGDGTTIASHLRYYPTGAVSSLELIAIDTSAPDDATYSLVFETTTAQSSKTYTISFVVFQYSDAQLTSTTSLISIPAGGTQTLLSMTPGYSTGYNLVIAILGNSGATYNTAGVFRIRKGTTIVSQDQFGLANNATHMLLYLDTTPSSTTSYSVEMNNADTAARSFEAQLFVMNVSAGNFVDSGAIGLNVSPKDISFSTTITAGTEALVILVGTKNPWGTNITFNYTLLYKEYTSKTVYNRDTPFHGTIIHLFPFRVNNPTLTIRMTGYADATQNLGEYKIVAIPLRTIPTEATETVMGEFIFPVETSLYNLTWSAKKFCDSFADINIKVYENDVLKNDEDISSSSLTTTYTDFTTQSQQGDGIFSTRNIRVLITTQVDYLNGITLKTDNTTYQTTRQYNYGSEWVTGPSLALTVRIFGFEPTEDVLVSGSASSVGTAPAWIIINIPPTVLRPNEYYAIIAYTVGGDTTNKYQLYKGGQVGDALEHLITSSNSGGSWTMDSTTDLSYQIMGYSMTRIYHGSISNNIVTPLGKVLAALIVKAQTSGIMEFAGFDDHTLTSSPVSSAASSQTLITVLAPDAPRLRDVEPSATLRWEIWAAGTGLATVAYTQRHTYYTTNPVYPKDFGYGELYLIADEIPPQALVVLNDNTAAALYNSSTAATRVDSYELFRVPVRKIEVIQEPSSGKIVMYLIGLP